MRDVLLLNGNWEILDVVSWRRAILLILKDKVRIIEEFSDKMIRFNGDVVNHPSVLALNRHVKIPFERRFRINKRNVLLRDGYNCMYCGERLNLSTITIDHVVPISKSGPHNWHNVAAACKSCNSKKGSKMLSDTKMVLRRHPYAPSKELVYVGYTVKPEYAHWKPYFTVKVEDSLVFQEMAK